MVLTSDYALAYLAYEMAEGSARVVFPVPAETAPEEWKPGTDALGAMSSAAGILVGGEAEPPLWVRQLEAKSVPVFVVGEDLLFHRLGYDPHSAAQLIDPIRNTLVSLVSGAERKESIAKGAAELRATLTSQVDEWHRLSGVFPRTKPLLALGDPAITPWAETYGISVLSARSPQELETSLRDPDSTRRVLAESSPSTYHENRLDALNAELRLLESARSKPAEGDYLDLLARNFALIRSCGEGTPLATLSPSAKNARTGSSTGDSKALGDGSFHGTVQPFLDRYCLECHDGVTAEGEINFENHTDLAREVQRPDFWEHVADLIEMGEMPPRKETRQPSRKQREQVITWAEALAHRWESGAMGEDPGRTTIRRLNKVEYNYTIRDLFGLVLRPADNFPEDSGGEAGFDNNADALFLPPLLMENYIEAAGLIVEAVYRNPGARARYLFEAPDGQQGPKVQARKILQYWATRAYRRPVGKSELDRLVTIFERELPKKKRFDLAMKMPLVAILISPRFLYRPEREKDAKGPYRVDDYDLANRLSYFLWSSMPDDRLFELAGTGKLKEPAVFEGEVIRLLNDPKAKALSMHFAGQWFGWEELRSRVDPDTRKFPEFTFRMRVLMYQESSSYFESLVRENGNLLDLIDSDYVFVNEDLARHYGIPGVTGTEIRKVASNSSHRGGVLGMASVLTATSLPLRTSPAIRGSWVLTEVLGTPTPAPPMNVPQLPEDDRAIEEATFRKSLEAHRENPNCRACHERIDPLGFGLENFDAIGRWRTQQNGNTLDTVGVLPDGTRFSNPADLKKILLDQKELFAHNAARKTLTYALARELTPYDRPTVKAIAEELIASNFQTHTLFLEVAKSYPFRHRRNGDYQPRARLTGDPLAKAE